MTHLWVARGGKVLFYKKLFVDSKQGIRGFSSMLVSNIDTFYDSKLILGGKIDPFGGCRGGKVLFYKKLFIDSKQGIRGFLSMLFSNIDTYYDSKFIWGGGGKIDLFGGCKV